MPLTHLELEPLVLDRVGEKGQLQLQQVPWDLSFRAFPYRDPILIAHLELEPLVLDGVGAE
jgi:hypothetical protein